MSTITHAQPWLDTTLYPFENKFIKLENGTMHYIDEGEGEVILFVHGTPTWSFLYRNYIKELAKTNRCIAIDNLGFGLSVPKEGFAGTPKAHCQALVELIEKLNLENITLVVHDFGGPIGIGAALQIPHRIKNIILFNTWLWETKNEKSVQKIDKIINSSLGKFLYLKMNFSPKVLLKKGFHNKRLLNKSIHRHYIKPFPNKASRQSLLTIAKSLVGSSDWYQKQWKQLSKLENKKWLILWGTRDQFITTKYLDKWTNRLPQAQIHRFECGHFVQEEQPVESINAIVDFLKTDKN